MRRMIVRQQVANKFHHVVGEVIGAEVGAASQRSSRDVIGSRRSTKSEVNPSRVQGLERRELFSDDEGSVIGQHDAS